MVANLESDASLPRLRAIEAKHNYKLTVTWEHGNPSTIDFGPTIRAGGVFAALENEGLFSRAQMSPDRRKIQWPEPSEHGEPIIDIDAESLRKMAQEQEAVVTFERISSGIRTLKKSLEKLAESHTKLTKPS